MKNIPLIGNLVSCGKFTFHDQELKEEIDLQDFIAPSPQSIYYARMAGDAMSTIAVDGDVLVIDRSAKVEPGSLIVAELDGKFLARRIEKIGQNYFLVPDNQDFERIDITKRSDFSLWGRVKKIIHIPK